MLLNVPTLLPDQTVESTVSRIQLANARTRRGDLVEELFGSRGIKIHKPYFSGLSKFFESPAGKAYDSFPDLIRQHSPLAAVLPFVEKSAKEDLLNRLKDSRINSLASVSGLRSSELMRSTPHYCPTCISNEIAELGYAYTHRIHQYSVVSSCPIHHQPLGTLQGSQTMLTPWHGLLVPNQTVDIHAQDCLDLKSDLAAATESLGLWIRAAVTGTLTHSSFNQRLALIQQRIEERPKTPSQPASLVWQLENLLTTSYGNGFLSDIGWSLESGNTTHWPAQFSAGQTWRNHFVPNVLILNLLFSDPEAFNDAARGQLDTRTSIPPTAQQTQRIAISSALIKDLLRMPSLVGVAEKHGIYVETLRLKISGDKRLKRHRVQALFRGKRRKHRRAVERLLDRDPNTVRSDVYEQERPAYNWLMDRDRQWFDQNLASTVHRKNVKANPTEINFALDQKLFLHLGKFHSECIDSLDGIWLTRKLFLGELKRQYKPLPCLDVLPKTKALIETHTETSTQYRDRVISRLRQQASQQDVAACIRLSSGLLLKFPKNRKVVEEIIRSIFVTLEERRKAASTA